MHTLSVRLPNYFRPCNFHCPYCTADIGANNVRYRWPYRENHRRIIENLLATPYRLAIRLGPAGEFFLSKELVADARYLTQQDKVDTVDLITNASLKRSFYEKAFEDFDLSKVSMTVSYHPTEIEDADTWKETVRYFRDNMAVGIVLVAYPPLMHLLPEIRKGLLDLDVPIFVNGFIGSFDGAKYPFAYSRLENQLLKSLSYSRHEYEFWINGRKPGLCRAGMTSIFVDIADGSVYSCGYPVRHRLGELLSGPNFELLSTPTPCGNRLCMCDSENYNPVVFDKHYEKTGPGLRQYRYRYAEDARKDPALDEWVIDYQ